jgi:hypothetical protein
MLQEKDLNKIAQLAGIDASALKDAIKSEDEVELTINKTKSFSDAEYSTLESNIGKAKWDEAKIAGEEMAVKEIKKQKGIEAEGVKTVAALYDVISDMKAKSDNEKVNELMTDKQKLQSQITELQQLNEKKAHEVNSFKANMIVESEINKIPFAVPESITDEKEKAAFLQAERNKAKLLFLNSYNVEFDNENNAILKKGDEIVKDDLQNAAKVGDVMPIFAKSNYFAMETIENKAKGRGAGDSSVKTDFANIKSTAELIEYAEKKGVKKGTPEMDALFAEFSKK